MFQLEQVDLGMFFNGKAFRIYNSIRNWYLAFLGLGKDACMKVFIYSDGSTEKVFRFD